MDISEDILNKIVFWEGTAQESFMDYFPKINPISLGFYMIGRGGKYKLIGNQMISDYNKFLNDEKIDDIICFDNNEIYYKYLATYNDGEIDDSKFESDMEVISEFLASNDTYLDRFNNFLEESGFYTSLEGVVNSKLERELWNNMIRTIYRWYKKYKQLDILYQCDVCGKINPETFDGKLTKCCSTKGEYLGDNLIEWENPSKVFYTLPDIDGVPYSSIGKISNIL